MNWIDECKPPCEIRSLGSARILSCRTNVFQKTRVRVAYERLLISYFGLFCSITMISRLCFSSSAPAQAENWAILNTIDNHAHPMGIKAEKVAAEILIRIHAKFLFCFMVHWNPRKLHVVGLDQVLTSYGRAHRHRHRAKFLRSNSIKPTGSGWKLKVCLHDTSQLLEVRRLTTFAADSDRICTIIIVKPNYIVDWYL
jgi:hypothetical protein